MTLSDAMRLGAAMVPQAFGDTFVRNGQTIVAACAWSSVSIGLGFPSIDVIGIYRRFPELHKTLPCPECDKSGYFGGMPTLEELITHMNDDHRWTREQIADWIDSLKPENEHAAEEKICTAV